MMEPLGSVMMALVLDCLTPSWRAIWNSGLQLLVEILSGRMSSTSLVRHARSLLSKPQDAVFPRSTALVR